MRFNRARIRVRRNHFAFPSGRKLRPCAETRFQSEPNTRAEKEKKFDDFEEKYFANSHAFFIGKTEDQRHLQTSSAFAQTSGRRRNIANSHRHARSNQFANAIADSNALRNSGWQKEKEIFADTDSRRNTETNRERECHAVA